ncbi:MAG: DUF454 domain-containing protein [Planctomycetes bacterium]|nr:DUF454 domain-containing protein [Planctomycetota bacterium]
MLSTISQTVAPTTELGLSAHAPTIATGWRRIAFLILAAVSFGCSLVGIVLPGIPTTPFLLLTSYFLLRSSQQLHDRLLASRIFGDLLSNWQHHRSIRRSTRTKAIGLTLAVVLMGIYLSEPAPMLLLAMLVGTTTGILVILSLPTLES